MRPVLHLDVHDVDLDMHNAHPEVPNAHLHVPGAHLHLPNASPGPPGITENLEKPMIFIGFYTFLSDGLFCS